MFARLLMGAAVSALASAAVAADLTFEVPDDVVPVIAAHDWSGLYFGVHVGGVFTADFDNNVPANPGPEGDAGGPIGGAQVGYNHQIGQWVFGIEGDFSAMDLKATSAGGRFEEDFMATARLRGGFAWDRFLAYATAGAAFTHVEARLTGASADDDVAVGPTAGLGVEAILLPSVSLKAEYLFVHVPEQSLTSGGLTIVGGSDNHIARVGANIQF